MSGTVPVRFLGMLSRMDMVASSMDLKTSRRNRQVRNRHSWVGGAVRTGKKAEAKSRDTAVPGMTRCPLVSPSLWPLPRREQQSGRRTGCGVRWTWV